jgi:hypothetical protein
MPSIEARLTRYAHDIQDQKAYLWESKADMDHVEKVFTRGVIEQAVRSGEAVLGPREQDTDPHPPCPTAVPMSRAQEPSVSYPPIR